MRGGGRQLARGLALAAALAACGEETSGNGLADSSDSTAAHGHVGYRVAIDGAQVASNLKILRGYVTLAGMTALPCGESRSWAEDVTSWLRGHIVPSAFAGHGESGRAPFELQPSLVVPVVGSHVRVVGEGAGSASHLCGLHVVLGRAKVDAPSLAELPEDVTMAQVTLHLELEFEGGQRRTVRTDVAWGRVTTGLGPVAAANATATLALRPAGAVASAWDEVDGPNASDKDLGRAVLSALLESAQVDLVPSTP